MKKRKIVIFMGIFLSAILVVALAGILLMRGGEKTKNTETVTEAEIEKTEVHEQTTEGTDGSCTFLSLGNIYYLLPEEEAGFKEQVRDFLKENGMAADTVIALGKVEDDKASPKGTAQFYLQLDDADRSVLQVRYEKETGKFSIVPYEETIENIEDYMVFPQDMLGRDDVFALRVQGDSMIEAGILDGDIIIVRRQETAENGDIVVAMIGDEATVKRIFYEKGRVRLQPENASMQPIYADHVQVLGKLAALFRQF